MKKKAAAPQHRAGYVSLNKHLSRDGYTEVVEGYVHTAPFGKIGRTITCHTVRSWKSFSFWLGAEAAKEST